MIEWKAGLGTVPAEIVSVITEFIRGVDILNLWLCGNKQLNYRMCEQGGVLRLHIKFGWRIRDLRNWPTVIPYFKKLETVGVEVGSPNVIGGDPFKAFALWPKTVKSLYLCFRAAEKCWSQCDAIADYFPVLERMELSGWSAFNGASLKKLPPTLTHLELTNNNSLTAEAIRDFLPQTIEHLILPGASKISPQVAAFLPKTLKSFQAAFTVPWAKNDILALPKSLTSLSINMQPSFASEIANHIPRGIKSLELRCLWGAVSHFVCQWPPTMETLLLRDGTVCIRFTDLPPSMTRLELGNWGADEKFDLALLPSSLRVFSVRIVPKLYTHSIESGLGNLPENLTELTIGADFSISNAVIASLPRFLQLLHLPSVSGIDGKCFKDLPRYLCSLDLARVQKVEDSQIADLPRWLTHLKIDSAILLTNAFAIHLPRGLRSLSIKHNGNFTFDCLPNMPTHIYDIDLGQTGVGAKYNSDLRKREVSGR